MSTRYITKNRNSKKEKYSQKKLKTSLVRSGASTQLIKQVCDEINEMFTKREISSNKIHDHILKILRRKSPVIAANYSLKRGIAQLGPSGYPFEVLCGEILKEHGYKTKVGATISGSHVTHEVDVVGVKPDRTIMGECKYHNSLMKKNDIKIPLYIHSRALDINSNSKSQNHDQFLIFSNTVFTLDAQKYAAGVGLRLISLADNDDNVIEYLKEFKIYPVTCLKSLNKKEQQLLLKNKIVTIKQFERNVRKVKALGFQNDKIEKTKNEIKNLRKG